jgi:very-short-patch-repair endonuclease
MSRVNISELSSQARAKVEAAAGVQAKAPKRRQPQPTAPVVQTKHGLKTLGSDGELALWEQMRRLGLPEPEPQYQIGGRGHRFDFGWSAQKLVVEVQGGIGDGKQAHSSYQGVTRDYGYIAAAAIAGYRVILLTTALAVDGSGALWVSRALDTVR